MKISKFNIIASAIFVVIMFVLSVLFSLGIDLDWSELKNASFWGEVAGKLAISLGTMNLYFEFDSQNHMLDPESRYYAVYRKFRACSDSVHKENLYEKLERAIEIKNEEYKDIAYDDYLHKHGSTIVNWVEFKKIESMDEARKICERRLMAPRRVDRVCKVLQKIFDGKVKPLDTLTKKALLMDLSGKDKHEGMTFNDKQFRAKFNRTKIVSYVGITIGLTIVQRITGDKTIFDAITENATLIGMAIVSAILKSREYVVLRTNAFEERYKFMETCVLAHPVDEKIVKTKTAEEVAREFLDKKVQMFDLGNTQPANSPNTQPSNVNTQLNEQSSFTIPTGAVN